MNVFAYNMLHDASHIKSTKSTAYDATLVPFEGDEYVCGWVGTELPKVPEPILFEANFKITRQSDFPCNDVSWPLMSPRMLEILRGVGGFPHRCIPIRLVDRTALGSARYRPDGSLRPEVVDDRCAAVQITEHIDVVDWEHSTFKPSRINPKSGYFDKLTLVEPAGGLPPLFRIPSDVSMLLVSADARRVLEAAGIRGIKFLSLPGARQADAAS
jgi:hypothetical protein